MALNFSYSCSNHYVFFIIIFFITITIMFINIIEKGRPEAKRIRMALMAKITKSKCRLEVVKESCGALVLLITSTANVHV